MQSRSKRNRNNRLVMRIFWSNLIVIGVILVLTTGITAVVQSNDMRKQIDQNIFETALIISEDPGVRRAFYDGAVSDEIMEYLDSVIEGDDSADFIVLANTDSIRLYHPDHSMIGQHFQGGDEGPATEGADTYITTGKGSRYNQRRCFVSIKSDSGEVLGFVMVSRYTSTIRNLLIRKGLEFAALFAAGLLIAAVVAVLLSNTIRRQLLGYEPSQIARMFLQREEILDGLTDGILLVNDKGRCEYRNGAATKILGGEDPSDMQPFINEYILDTVISREASLQETIRTGDMTLLVDVLPVWNESSYAGSLVVINDKTESVRIAAQLTGVDQIIGALRASTHETKNRMHVILGLLQIGEVDEAIEFIQSAAGYDEEADRIRALIQNNTLAALLIGKRNRARELGIDLRVRKDSELGEKSSFLTSAELVTICGNLIENAFDAISEKNSGSGEISLYIKENADMLMVTCDDTGCGMTPEQIDAVLKGGYTSKGENHGIGMGLIRNILKGSNGELEIESEQGEGTSVSVTVHRDRPQQAIASENSEA